MLGGLFWGLGSTLSFPGKCRGKCHSRRSLCGVLQEGIYRGIGAAGMCALDVKEQKAELNQPSIDVLVFDANIYCFYLFDGVVCCR